MPSGIRTFQLILGGSCAVLGIVVALEMVLPIVDEVTASPTDKHAVVADLAPSDSTVAQATLDSSIGEILQRPLFSADRRPPAPKQVAEDQDAAPPPAPPPLPARLAGVMVGPDGSEALFGEPGEKPVAVAVGGAIGGWTVAAIELDRVTLTSAFGDHVLQPSVAVRPDVANRAPRPQPPAARRAAVPVPPIQSQPGRPLLPTAQQRAIPPVPAVSTANRRANPRP